jgi:hypothetical protein
MGKVVLDVSISLDGFTAGPNVRKAAPMGDGGERLHAWMAGKGPEGEIDAAVRREVDAAVGAAVIGRRTFDLGLGPWGGTPWPGVPSFVVTHRARQVRTTGTDRVARGLPCPSGSVDGPSRPGRRRRGGGAGASGGAAVADLAGSRSGAGCGRARPLTGQGRPARREGHPSLPAEPGHKSGLKRDVLAPAGGGELGWTRDYAVWSLCSLTPEWTGLEEANELDGADGRGPSAAQPGIERDRLGANDAVTCENSGGCGRS